MKRLLLAVVSACAVVAISTEAAPRPFARFGVSYYPEDRSREQWTADVALMKELGVDMVRLGEFNWSGFEPKEGVFDFSQYHDFLDLIGRNGQFTDMMMVTLAGNSINLILQPKNALLDMYTDEQIFTLSADAMKSQFTAAGYSVETFEPVKMEIAGQERTILHMVLNAGGVMADEYQIWLRSDCDYMGILTVAILDGSDPQPILAGITALN